MKSKSLKTGTILGGVLLSAVFALGLSAAASAAEPDGDRYIVSFLDVAKGKAALKAAGARVELELAGREAAAVHIPPRALNGLRNNPNIEYIEKDALRYPMAQTTPWGIPAVQADVADLQPFEANRKICIIDSGYAKGHEDLPSANVTGGANWDTDSCFHGSHVAGTISALTNGTGVVGVLPNANVNLHIVKVFDGADCAWSYSSTLVAALDECLAARSNVVSMSLGGGVKSRTEERAFANAYNQGVLSVAAAGNDGNTRNSYPASYTSVVSVAAVDSAGVVADFSQQNTQVELSGPGVAVRSTVGMGSGLEESLTVNGEGYEVTGMDGSFKGFASGPLHRCDALDGLGSPGDCSGANQKVCVINRGALNFDAKVLECQRAGGVAAVIVNNADALYSGTLGGTATSIPSVGIAGADGAALTEGSSATVTVQSGNYAFYDGTSMATPHVSGVAALLWSQDTSCSNADIRSTLAATALDLGPAGRDNAYGYGLVQVATASAALNCGGDGGGGGGGGGSCEVGQLGDACGSDAECCSGSCKGKPGNQTCK